MFSVTAASIGVINHDRANPAPSAAPISAVNRKGLTPDFSMASVSNAKIIYYSEPFLCCNGRE